MLSRMEEIQHYGTWSHRMLADYCGMLHKTQKQEYANSNNILGELNIKFPLSYS
jgi:hypothetical protein